MANHKSALKRAKQNRIRRARNKIVKTGIKNAVKKVRASANEGSKEDAATMLKEAQSIIDRAAKKGVIHNKTASRKISRLSAVVNSRST